MAKKTVKQQLVDIEKELEKLLKQIKLLINNFNKISIKKFYSAKLSNSILTYLSNFKKKMAVKS